jgi:antitoxin component YwqK of YwqJK toxin-antitoxin module
MAPEEKLTLDQIDYDEDLRAIYGGEHIYGEVVELDAEGRTVAVTTFTDGVKDGPWRTYYPNSRLKAECSYRMGLPDGLSRTWHPNGAPASEATFEYGDVVAERAWSEDGTEVDPKTGQPVG